MRTNTLNPLPEVLSATHITTVKIILCLLFLAYGIFNFSTSHWVLIGLVVVAIMAISERISGLNATPKTNASHKRVINSDGGTFSQPEESRQVRFRDPVVQDGGLFKRKH